MPQKNKQFRFKIPWISSGASASSSHVPKQRSKSSSAQPDTNIVIKQRPPFRPPGIAPAPSPTSSVILESPSPVCSPPSTPNVVSSPSRFSSSSSIEVPPTKPVTEEEQEKKKMKSPPLLQTIPNSGVPNIIEILKESTLPPPSSSSSQKEKYHSKMKSPLLKNTIIPKELQLETQRKSSNQSEAKEKIVVVQDDKKQGKVKSIPRSKKEVHKKDASTSNAAIRADRKKQKESHESVESKMMFAKSSSSGKEEIKVVSKSNISPEKSFVLSNEDNKKGSIKDDISNFVHKLATVNPTQPVDDNKNVSVVTLAGENRGATMHVGYSHSTTKKEGSIHIHRAYKTTNPEESSTDEEEKSGTSSMEEKDDDVGKTYVNSNIQSVNNSMLLHGSITERDPGVRVILPQQPAEQTIIKPAETRKAAEVHINRSKQLPNRPVVRRRCLRGLLMEPSDSDPDNPDKPRRHGCKFRCGDIGNSTEIM